MKYEKLLEFAKPYLEKNDLGEGHTLRVLDIAKNNYSRYDLDESWKNTVFSLIVLHDVGGSEIKDQYEGGPATARKLMERLEYPKFDINLICKFIARHHERLENPHDVFKVLFDADRLVMFSREEFGHYNSRQGFDWDGIIKSFYNDKLRSQAKKLLKQRLKDVKKKDNKD